ncbi:metallopeptidase family protein [Candidatus Saccharibacteria bacterium]|nr:metallopeptidase family protein [Candidatus Saccharibacteria bacterium]
MDISDVQFHELIDRAFDSLPKTHRDRVKNVAIVTADEPTEQQRVELALHCNQTLLGLYEGVPLPMRQGREPTMPDVITLFKQPLLSQSYDQASLYENIRHTLWHEVAHYFGLNHAQIHKLEH